MRFFFLFLAFAMTFYFARAEELIFDEEIFADKESLSGKVEFRIVVGDDNNNAKLPPAYRTWWYARIDGADTSAVTVIHIVGDGWKGREIALPVYSYDRNNWHRFKPEEIDSLKPAGKFHNYSIFKKFDSSATVWIARYYPYPLSRLGELIKRYKMNPLVKLESIGKTALGRSIPMFTVTDPNTDDKLKKRFWIHARTHPSETGSSFVAEGLLDFLASECNKACKTADLSKLIFHIVPIVNMDGVALGMARVTPDSSIDLERQWLREADNISLQKSAAVEVQALHSTITRLQLEGPEFIAAINIHSKNAPPDWRSFLYTNFRKPLEAHGSEGDSMFVKHLQFAKSLTEAYCRDTVFVRLSYDPSVPMDKKPFPESWWWANFKNGVMAVTLETTSGRDGCFNEWVTERDHIYLGEALAEAAQNYYKTYIERKWERWQAPVWDLKELMKFFKTGDVDSQ